jgi:apolipoprotein N-acyltransferase
MRALEFELPMLRATNTGATVFIDHRGRVVRRLPPYTSGVLDGEIEGRSGLTPYASWASRWGLWPLAALAVVLTLLTVGRARRDASSGVRPDGAQRDQ